MEGMEEKLGAILDNPQLMQQIMQLAQSVMEEEPVGGEYIDVDKDTGEALDQPENA